MGIMISNGIQIGDNGRQAALPDGLARKLAAEDAERRQRAHIATAKMLADRAESCRAAAARSVAILTKNAARRYLLRPWFLDAIYPGLSVAEPRIALRIIAAEMGRVERFVGFSGVVRPSNLRGAALAARYERRFGERAAMLEAAE